MILVGLTGGIGSGKSTVSALLAERGAVIVDADLAARVVQEPGSPVLEKMAERFGAQVITEAGTLDRAAVAAIVFADADALEGSQQDRAPGGRRRDEPSGARASATPTTWS